MIKVVTKNLIVSIASVAALFCVCNLHAQETAATTFKLPPMNASVDPVVYPSAALKSSVQGKVLLDFTISKRSKIEDVKVLDSEPEGMFDSAARKALDSVKFTVPKDWEDSGAALHRFSLSFVFKISPCPTTPCVVLNPHENADDFLIITAAAKR